MRIYLNGNTHEVDGDNLADALKALGYGETIIATAVNGSFVPSERRNDFKLSDDDEIEVVAPMQGG